MSIALITGGNKGIGKATARRLTELGHTVYIGARDAERGQSAAKEIGAQWLALDVTGDASAAAAAAELTDREGHLDILVNNAGVTGAWATLDNLSGDDMRAAYEVNVFGIVRVTQAFLPLLRASQAPVIVNVSSLLGSFGAVSNPYGRQYEIFAPIYGSSKSAVNMLTVQYAKALPEMRINAVEPGYTATDLTGAHGDQAQTPEEAAANVVRWATIGPDGPTGIFGFKETTAPW
jgi:NAD(P)-dependent dehydrogenase (short-subunit alcohol dehydrogenase family)